MSGQTYPAAFHKQLLDTLGAKTHGEAMELIGKMQVLTLRSMEPGQIVLNKESGELLRDRLYCEMEEWGVSEDIITGLTDSVLAIVRDALKVG